MRCESCELTLQATKKKKPSNTIFVLDFIVTIWNFSLTPFHSDLGCGMARKAFMGFSWALFCVWARSVRVKCTSGSCHICTEPLSLHAKYLMASCKHWISLAQQMKIGGNPFFARHTFLCELETLAGVETGSVIGYSRQVYIKATWTRLSGNRNQFKNRKERCAAAAKVFKVICYNVLNASESCTKRILFPNNREIRATFWMPEPFAWVPSNSFSLGTFFNFLKWKLRGFLFRIYIPHWNDNNFSFRAWDNVISLRWFLLKRIH